MPSMAKSDNTHAIQYIYTAGSAVTPMALPRGRREEIGLAFRWVLRLIKLDEVLRWTISREGCFILGINRYHRNRFLSRAIVEYIAPHSCVVEDGGRD
jgi:hypothetical protein